MSRPSAIAHMTARGQISTSLGHAARFGVLVATAACLTLLSACGGSTDVSKNSQGVIVSIDPSTANVPVGESITFTAHVQNAGDTSVTWQVNGTAGGSASIGTITATGVYTAPETYAANMQETVTAVSNADSSKSAAAQVTIGPIAPTTPANLVVTSVTNTAVALSWSSSTDNGGPGLAGYDVFRNGQQVAQVTTNSFADSGLTAGTAYSYYVVAYDTAMPPNVSTPSALVSVTTTGMAGTSSSSGASSSSSSGSSGSSSSGSSSGSGPSTIMPGRVSLTLRQRQQFTTNAGTGVTLAWAVDGVTGGNAAAGTIDNSGNYTPGTSPGVHTVSASNAGNPALNVSATVAVTDLTGVYTYNNDLARTGQNLQEYALTPATVTGGNFGKRWSCAVDGLISAQPLYVANVSIGGGTHNVLFIATMHDSVYAFDADSGSCTPYWHTSFLSAGVTTVPSTGCTDTPVEFGITGTPVIDPSSQTIYLVANTNENGGTSYLQRLHALNLSTGAEQANSPMLITATVPGTGDGGSTVSFNGYYENQRPGLALYQGGVFIAWGSHCDNTSWPWHGWVMRYDASTLSQTAVFNVTPNGSGGGIWMSGGAPSVDSSGRMFVSTANGTFDNTADVVPAPNNDMSMSFLNLSPSSLGVQDFYTPSKFAAWSTADFDMSVGSLLVLPDNSGPAGHANLLVGVNKSGHLWSLDRNDMSGYVPGADNTVQYLTIPNSTNYSVFNVPAYYNGVVYVSVVNGPLMAFQISNGLFATTSGQVAIASSRSTENYGYAPPSPRISASPSGGAVAWAIESYANGTVDGSGPLGPAILRAYDATNLGSTLWASNNSSADTASNASKFISPVVANGHVYLAGNGGFTVYGLAP